VSAAAAVLAVALLLWAPPDTARRRRLRSLTPAGPSAPAPASRWTAGVPPGPGRRWAEAGACAVAVFLLLGRSPLAALVAGCAGVALERLLKRPSAGAADDRGQLGRDLPVACDLIAVCLGAGTPVGAALVAVAGAVPGPLGERLAEVGALYRLGAAPRRAWHGVPPPVDVLARTVVRAGESGSAVVPALQRLAADLRSSDRSETEAAVRRAGVWVLAPLGLCFLPAFLCLGVVPLVLGIAADVFG
jgi:Flp pilus assembly protein TadB